jgi:hypothetical protein
MRTIPANPNGADITFWEVTYTDNTTASEDTITYGQIDRSRLKSFRLVQGAEVVFEMIPPPGFDGNNLVYRRRTRMGEGGDRNVIFVLGWAPNGPAFAIDIVTSTYRVLETGFDPADPDLYPPMAFPGEPDIY